MGESQKRISEQSPSRALRFAARIHYLEAVTLVSLAAWSFNILVSECSLITAREDCNAVDSCVAEVARLLDRASRLGPTLCS